MVDNQDGIVLDYRVMVGNPPDAPLLAPAIARIKALAGKAPRAVTADRGYGEARVETDLEALGVKRVAIPRKGKADPARRQVQKARGFRRLVKWRTGAEGRISHLKHAYGWDRALMVGIRGAEVWCGLGILAHNSVKISGLIEARANRKGAPAVRSRAPDPVATGPPSGPPPEA